MPKITMQLDEALQLCATAIRNGKFDPVIALLEEDVIPFVRSLRERHEKLEEALRSVRTMLRAEAATWTNTAIQLVDDVLGDEGVAPEDVSDEVTN